MSLVQTLHPIVQRCFIPTILKLCKGKAFPYVKDGQYLASFGREYDAAKKQKINNLFVCGYKIYPLLFRLCERDMPANPTADILEIKVSPQVPYHHQQTSGFLKNEISQILSTINRTKPQIIKGAMDYWREYKTSEYTQEGIAEYLHDEQFGLNVRTVTNELKMRVDDMIDHYFLNPDGASTDDEPLIMYDKQLSIKLIKIFPKLWLFPEDLLITLFDGKPVTNHITLEPYRGGLPIKRSRFGFDYWSALTEGQKLWICFPPEVTRKQLGAEYYHRGGNEWFLNHYVTNLLDHPGRLEFIQNHGEVVYIPHHWWFKWISLSDRNTSFATYFVDRVNIRDSWRDIGGSLPEIPESIYEDDREIQDDYPEHEGASMTPRLSGMSLRTSLWPHWKHYLMAPQIVSQTSGKIRKVTEEDFWRTPYGAYVIHES